MKRRHPGSQNTWEVVKKEDGTFDLFCNQELLRGAIPDRWLESQLVQYGLCGQEYREIRQQLEKSGKVEIVL